MRILEEAKALQALGHRVEIVTYHLGCDVAQIPVSRTPLIPWYRKQTAGPSWHKPYLDILLFFKALQVARRFRPHVIHAHLHEGAFVGRFLKAVLKVPLVFDCQGSLTAELADHDFVREGSALFRFFSALERRINNWPEHIVTSSTSTAQLLMRHFALPGEKVTPVVDGVDTEDFHPVEDVEALREELKLPEGQRIVVYLGAMSAYQGLDLLLETIRILKARRQDVHFLLMGYPCEEYRERAAEKGLSDCITFTGRIDYQRAAQYLSLGEVAVSPKLARTEANGKLYNYMACGLPAVVFDTPVNREILADAGIYAAYDDKQDFASKLESILHDSAKRQRLSRLVRERAQRRHSWSVRGENLVEVYRKIGVGKIPHSD